MNWCGSVRQIHKVYYVKTCNKKGGKCLDYISQSKIKVLVFMLNTIVFVGKKIVKCKTILQKLLHCSM